MFGNEKFKLGKYKEAVKSVQYWNPQQGNKRLYHYLPRKTPNRDFLLRVSYLEIYNELVMADTNGLRSVCLMIWTTFPRASQVEKEPMMAWTYLSSLKTVEHKHLAQRCHRLLSFKKEPSE